MFSNFAEKEVIALAFFICIGLIVKFFGKKINSLLNNKKKEIILDIDNLEANLRSLKNEEKKLIDHEKQIKAHSYELIKNAENEKENLIKNLQEDLQENYNNKLILNSGINDKFHSEIENQFHRVSWDASLNLLKNSLIGSSFGSEENKTQHKMLIDKFLKQAIK